MTKDEVLKEVLNCDTLSSDAKIYIIQNLSEPKANGQTQQKADSVDSTAMFNAIKDIELTNPVGGITDFSSFSPILSLHKNLDMSRDILDTEIIEED